MYVRFAEPFIIEWWLVMILAFVILLVVGFVMLRRHLKKRVREINL